MKTVIIITYYKFPCSEPVLENVFAKELGRYANIWWLFRKSKSGKGSVKWHNSRVILSPKFENILSKLKITNVIYDIQILTKLVLFLQSNHVDMVLVRDMPLLARIIGLLKKKFKFKLYFQYTAPLGDISIAYAKVQKGVLRPLHRSMGMVFNANISSTLKKADLVFPISDAHKMKLSRLNSEKKMIPVTMGVDEQWARLAKQSCARLQQQKANDYWITYFGSLSSTREPHFILNMFSKLISVMPNVRLILIGSANTPGEERELKALCADLKLADRVTFTGFLNKTELRKYLWYTDVSISAIPPKHYYKISSPTKLYEALGVGVPVVANNGIDEHEKVINASKGGLLVEYDEHHFSQAIVTILKNPILREHMAIKGREYVLEKYGYKAIARNITKYFQ